MITIEDGAVLLARHERAVRLSVEAVRVAEGSPLDLETPCAGWDLGDLLTHMSTQNRGFAAAARGEDDPAVWEARRTIDPVGDYLRSAAEVIAAFAAPEALTRTLSLPEIPPGRFPAPLAVSFHLIDSVVHAWDVARSLGRSIYLDPDLAPTALSIAEAVPTGAPRRGPDAAFAPVIDTPAGSETLDRILRLLGRSPAWTPEFAALDPDR
ncbi:TIGR03086 family protein [Nocardia mangyaensis]|uniref:TIGR03086 family protein n=1 Tax=Nocardia mangyaensis TaxID=2213200 RepID=A0A1J0VMA6_9NOCA|nr:TIGR03086 family metal-binding protein [Nocardia mangyaensis]APE33152.1 TIGR03086 family protein [Nocardia mangyaensis]